MSRILKLILSLTVSSALPKCHDKNIKILRTKRAFKIKQKGFFVIFKGLSLKQIKRNAFGRWGSDSISWLHATVKYEKYCLTLLWVKLVWRSEERLQIWSDQELGCFFIDSLKILIPSYPFIIVFIIYIYSRIERGEVKEFCFTSSPFPLAFEYSGESNVEAVICGRFTKT